MSDLDTCAFQALDSAPQTGQCHGGAPAHANTIAFAAKAVDRISERGNRYALGGPFDPDFTVPHATMLGTMLGTMMEGGVATNVTPEACTFTFELRSISGMEPERGLQCLLNDITQNVACFMQEKIPQTGIRFEEIFSYPAMGGVQHTRVQQVFSPVARMGWQSVLWLRRWGV